MGVRVAGDDKPRRKSSKLKLLLVGVAFTMWAGVLVGVRVTDGVRVGVAERIGVTVTVEEGVRVGNVAVGNGPRRAFAVPARAVLVFSMFACACPCIPSALGRLKMRL